MPGPYRIIIISSFSFPAILKSTFGDIPGSRGCHAAARPSVGSGVAAVDAVGSLAGAAASDSGELRACAVELDLAAMQLLY